MSFSKSELDSAYDLVFNYPFTSRGVVQPVAGETNPSFAVSRQFQASSTTGHSAAIAGKREPREVIFEGKLIVKGYIAGDIYSLDGELVIESSGEIDGEISVSSATIHGRVRGDIRAPRKVELGATAHVIGDIETAELRIRSPAIFKGECTFPKAGDPLEIGSARAAIDEREELAFALGG